MPLFSFLMNQPSPHPNDGQEGNGHELDDRDPSPTQTARAGRMMEEIRSNNYTCNICTEAVQLGHGGDYNLWHCKDCHTVWHYRCIKNWEYTNRQSVPLTYLGLPSWRCPTCSAPQKPITGQFCWCGKLPHSSCQIGSANACGQVCGSTGKCPHGKDNSCVENCHPGPCKYACSPECTQAPIPPAKPLSTWGRFCKRAKDRKMGTFRTMALYWAIIAVIYGVLGALLHYHIRWITMPYKYPDFNPWEEAFWLLLIGFPIYLIAMVLIAFMLSPVTLDFLGSAMNIEMRNRQTGRNCVKASLVSATWIIFMCGVIILPMFGFLAGPDLAWRHKWSSGCSGLDARIDVTDYKGRFKGWDNNQPRWRLEGGTELWYLARHIDTSAPFEAPFRYFSRFSGSAANSSRDSQVPVAVDVDIENRMWRLQSLASNETDNINKWLAYDYKKLWNGGEMPLMPHQNMPHYTTIKTGTFNQVSKSTPDLEIPEVSMTITNMHLFLTKPRYEPFLRVFDTAVYNSTYGIVEGAKVTNFGPWNPLPYGRENIRMAAFGYGRSSLTMCVWGSHWDGILMENVVPMAIITAMRERYIETGKRKEYSSAGLW